MARKPKNRISPQAPAPIVPPRVDEPVSAPVQPDTSTETTPGGVRLRRTPGPTYMPLPVPPEQREGAYVSAADFVPDTYGLATTDERRRFGSVGIERQNAFEREQDTTRVIPAESVERDPLNPYAPTPGALAVLGADPDAPSTVLPPARQLGQAAISRTDALSVLPVSMRDDWTKREDFVISNYPTVYRAAQEAGLTQSEVRDVVNITLAVDAALTVGKTVDPRRQVELLKSMPKPQAALVVDILNAMSEEQARLSPQIDSRIEVAGLNSSVELAQRALEASTGDVNQNPILGAIRDWFWNPSINLSGLSWIYPDTDWGPVQDGELYFGGKGVFDSLIAANEMAVRGANTLQLSGLGTNMSLESAWNATEAGSFDPVMIAEIRANNNPLLVDVMLDFKRLATTGDPDPIAALLEKYGNDPDALAFVDQVLFNTDPNSDISKLGNEIDSAETSNIGNVFAWSFASMFGADASTYEGIESFAGNPATRGGAKLVTMGSTVALDPTLGASRVAAGYRVARYGLAKMEPGRVGEVFEKTAVRNHYDYLGKQFEEIRNAEDVGKKAQRLETLASQNRKWYSYDAVRTMYDAGIKDAASAKLFFESGGNMEVLLSGQAMKRGREWTVPHMTKANSLWKATSFRLRGLNPANMGGSKKYIDAVFGEGTSTMMPDDAAEHIARVIEKDPEQVGRMLSDFVYTDTGGVERTMLGKIIGTDATEHAMRNRYGWRRKGLLTGDFGWFSDRLGRLMARMPDTSRGIYVADATDAGKVKEVAQSLGMSRYFANYLKFIWPAMDEPSRVRLINGLNSSAITASGVDLVAPELASDLTSAFAVASRPTTQYAADQVDVLAIRTLAERRVENMDAERRALNTAMMTADERAQEVAEEVERLTRATATYPIYRVDPADAGIAWDKPQGLYTSQVEDPAKSPHRAYIMEDAGGEERIVEFRGRVRQSDVFDVAPSEISLAGLRGSQWGVPSSTSVDAGVGYVLGHMDDGEEWIAVGRNGNGTTMSDEFKARLESFDSSVDWDQYADNYERLMAVGGIQARRDGHKAIRMVDADFAKYKDAFPDYEDMTEIVVLDRSAVLQSFGANRTTPLKVPGLSPAERQKAFRDEYNREFQNAVDNGLISNPSRLNDTDNYALYDTQLTKRVSIFDAQKMSQLMARQSYLNMLLGGGPKITTTTDLWTLATLAGPRFIMRSGLEDFGLYALTGGKFFGHGGWLDSRRASTAIREAILRGPSDQIIRGNNPGMKLGLAATARREIGTALARRMPVFRGLILPYLDADEVAQATLMAAQKGPEKSRQGIANLVATGIARGRFFSSNRIRYAVGDDMRLTGEAKEAADIISEGVRRGYLNANMDRASEVTEHLADGSATALHRGPQPELTELVEGVSITYKPVGVDPSLFKNGLDVRQMTTGYRTTFETGRRNPKDIEDFWNALDQSLYQSGYKSYLAIAQSQQYYRLRMAVLQARTPEKAADAQIKLEEFITDFASQFRDDPNLPSYVLAAELGVEEFGKRLLDDALRMMTTRTGKFNARLYDRLRLPNHRVVRISEDLAERQGLPFRPNKSGLVRVVIDQEQYDDLIKIADDVDRGILEAAGRPIKTYKQSGEQTERRLGLYYIDDQGKFHYNLDVNGLYDPELPMPHSIGTSDEITVPVSDKMPFTSGAWSRMGRALARMTREPIYLSNYHDAYKAVGAFKQGMIDDLIRNGKNADEAKEMAEDWAHKFAADKAYDMTMAGVDNPAIRSQMAWQVRNIARFYRALEDFNRRMVRVASNKPETFWKLALTWNVLDDSGFVWEDEYGEKYLMFPGTQAAFQGINALLSTVGVQAKVPSLPMTWGAKVTMFSPSTDPNAIVPTLGSPYSALTVKTTLRLLPSMGWISKESSQAMEGALFGEYSPQQTLTAALASDVFGPNLKRMFDSFTATYGGTESRQSMTDTAVAVASKQAIHAMAAAGIFDPSKDYTPDEVLELRAIADTTAMNAVYLKMIMTPLLAATPQIMSSDVSDEARAIGIDSRSALWIKYLNQYPSYEDAFIAFTKENPGKAMFTVSKYKNTDFYEQTLQTQDFIEKNRTEFEARPTGLSHFAPIEGTYGGLTSFYFARANGIKVPTTVEDFFNKTIRAAGQAEMRFAQMEAAALVEQGYDANKVEQALSREKDNIRLSFPYAEYEMAFDADRKAASARDAEEIAATARYMMQSGQDTDGRAKTYLDVYNEYKIVVRWQSETEKGSKDRTRAGRAWRSYVENEALALMPADDDRWVRWLKILSAGLNVQVEALSGR